MKRVNLGGLLLTLQSVGMRLRATLRWCMRDACFALTALLGATSPLMAETLLPPTVSLEFYPLTMSPGGLTTLYITITNPNPNTGLTGIGGFSVDLSPLNMTSFGIGTSGCSGHSAPNLSSAAAAGSSIITFDPGTELTPGFTCSIPYIIFLAVDAPLGTKYATTSSGMSSDNGGTGSPASPAPITAVANGAPQLTESFDAASIPQFGTTFMRLTPVNPNNGTLTGVAFTDTLPAGLTIVGAGPSCSQGSLNVGTSSFNLIAEPGTNLISFSDGILYPTNPCSVLVQVQGIGLGLQTNTTSTITSTNGGTGDSASASITVFDQVFQNGFEQN